MLEEMLIKAVIQNSMLIQTAGPMALFLVVLIMGLESIGDTPALWSESPGHPATSHTYSSCP